MSLSLEFLERGAVDSGFRVSALEKVVRLGELASDIGRHPLLGGVLILKGGTALNLCYGPPKRLSVDLDFNYVGQPEREKMLRERPLVETALVELARKRKYRVQQSAEAFAGAVVAGFLDLRAEEHAYFEAVSRGELSLGNLYADAPQEAERIAGHPAGASCQSESKGLMWGEYGSGRSSLPRASSPGIPCGRSVGLSTGVGASCGMSMPEPPPIRTHQDRALFREAVNYTAAATGFPSRLIKKDYFCSVLLQRLAGAGCALVFLSSSARDAPSA